MSTDAIGLNAANHAAPVAKLAAIHPLIVSDSTPQTAATADVSDDEGVPLSRAVEELNRYVAGSRTDLKFTVDRDAGQVVVTIIDSESGQVLRQMPSVEAIRIARYLEHDRQGLIRQQA